MTDKIREVALRVAREMYSSGEMYIGPNQESMTEFLSRCLQELSKDVEPVAWCAINHEGEAILRWDRDDQLGWKPLYSAPPLTEQDKLDAARYRWLRERMDTKDVSIFKMRNDPDPEVDEEVDASIDKAMENGK